MQHTNWIVQVAKLMISTIINSNSVKYTESACNKTNRCFFRFLPEFAQRVTVSLAARDVIAFWTSVQAFGGPFVSLFLAVASASTDTSEFLGTYKVEDENTDVKHSS